MSRHRIHCLSTLEPNSSVILEGTQAHYLGHVLRVRVGQEVTLFDGGGPQYSAEVMSVERKRVELRTSKKMLTDSESSLRVTLIQSVVRSERMDFCVQKATELGVHEVIPVFTHRTIIKIPQDRVNKRTDHWQKIAVSACEQSGRVLIPKVLSPLSLQDAVARTLESNTILLVLDPWADPLPLQKYTPPEGASVAICIGPEGGFTQEELNFLRDSGAVSVTCGPRVLRSETAGIVAVAACQMLWGDW